MPVSAADIIVSPYDSLFSEAGVQYACQSLRLAYNRTAIEEAEPLRRLVTGVAFEMAVRRWLEAQPVPYNRLSAAAFTDPHRFDLAIGGRRCSLKSGLIANKREIINLHANPHWLLKALAAIPPEELESDRMGEQDIYVFGFVTGLKARHSADTEKALAKDQPTYLISLLPTGSWGGGGQWRSLGGLVLKSNANEAVQVEINGLGANREPLQDRLTLQPLVRTPLTPDYFSVQYIRVAAPPSGAIGLHSPALGQTHLIAPADWENIWVYGMRVYMCGWINKNDFRSESQRHVTLNTARPVYLNGTRSRVLPIAALRSMTDLAAIAQQYGGAAQLSPDS